MIPPKDSVSRVNDNTGQMSNSPVIINFFPSMIPSTVNKYYFLIRKTYFFRSVHYF